MYILNVIYLQLLIVGKVQCTSLALQAAMLRCYVEDNPGLWCLYAPALCYAYNMSVHSTTGTPFDLVLSRPPPEFNRDHRPQSRMRTARAQKSDRHQGLYSASRRATKETSIGAYAQREGFKPTISSSWIHMMALPRALPERPGDVIRVYV